MMVWKMIFLFQGCILRFHVNLPGCVPGTCLSSILGLQPPKTRPKLQSKQGSFGFQVYIGKLVMIGDGLSRFSQQALIK